jgi:hypothetical protein
LVLVKVVWNAAGVKDRECRSVERVLRDGDHDASFRRSADGVEERVHAR